MRGHRCLVGAARRWRRPAAGRGRCMYIVTIMLNFMNAGHGTLTESRYHAGRISAAQHEFHRRLKFDV
eukprot:4385950-Heterocapsa_arctica.AAC.1